MIEFLTVTFVAALMIISPGPDFAIVVKNSLVQGRLSGYCSALGIAFANLCHVTVNLLGIGVIISQSVIAFTLMKIFGALYLLYLGIKGICAKPALKNRIHQQEKTKVSSIKPHKGLLSGFITSILNPKACLFFLSFFSVMLSPATELRTQIFYGVWISLLALIWFVLVAFFFTTPMIGQKLQNSKHWIERITGGVLMLLSLKLLSSKASI